MIVNDASDATRPIARFAFAADCGRAGVSDDANALTLFLLASGDNGSRASLTNDAPSLLALSDAISARRASFSAFADQALARASSSAALIVAALALDDIAFAFARPSSTREHRCAKRSVDTV